MFKVGDWVVAEHRLSFIPAFPRNGELYQVKSAYGVHIGVKLRHDPINGIYKGDIENGIKPNWGEGLFRLATQAEIDRHHFPARLEDIINDA